MYSVVVNNTEANRQKLKELGIKLSGFGPTPVSDFIGVQLNLLAATQVGWVSDSTPHIDIEHVAPLLVIPTTLARIEYLYSVSQLTHETYYSLKKGYSYSTEAAEIPF